MRTDLYWIEGPWSGKLAIAPRPRGGEWLEEEISTWQAACVQVVVSLLVGPEISELDLTREKELCQAHDIELIAFPINDRGVPPSLAATQQVVKELKRLLTNGQTIVIHCRQGVGRSALLAACLLVTAGLEPEAAFVRIGQARGSTVPDTVEQKEWVTQFARTHAILTSSSSSQEIIPVTSSPSAARTPPGIWPAS